MEETAYAFVKTPRASASRPTIRGLLENCCTHPASGTAANALAVALLAHDELDRALEYARRAVRLEPGVAAHHYTLGRVLFNLEQLHDAAESYERALAIEPDSVECCTTLGQLYIRRLGNPARSLKLFVDAIRLDPTNHFAHVGVGRCAIQDRSIDQAAAFARQAAPFADPFELDQGIARALEHYGRYEEALEMRLRLLTAVPAHIKTLNALGRIADALCDDEAALRYHQRAFQLDPRNGETFFYYLFKLGEFDRAKDVYWAAKPELRELAAREGTPWLGKTVLLESIGGYGDTIQFGRFAALLGDRGARVIFECQKPACKLAESIPGVDLAVGKYDERPDVDIELRLFLETHLIMGADIEQACAGVPYLGPPVRLRQAWRERLSGHSGLKVGLCWAGSTGALHNPHTFRSISLAELRPLLELPGFTFLGLQKEPIFPEISRASDGISIENLGSGFRDLNDAAAAILACDLVVSVDTSIGHLAGALGVPVFLFLPSRACYRWMRNRSDTLWYPTMRLFRQIRPRDWSAPIQDMQQAMCEFRDSLTRES
jgi:tetratricopeptide (TPR) repeat protein